MWTWGFLSAFDLAWILCLSRFTFSCLFSFEGLLIGLVALFLFIFSHFVTVCVFLCVISSVEFCFFAFTICLGVLSLRFFFSYFTSMPSGWQGLGTPFGSWAEPPRCESQVQDIGRPETYWPHVILISESSPKDLHLNTKTQLQPTASKLQCRTSQAKQLAR